MISTSTLILLLLSLFTVSVVSVGGTMADATLTTFYINRLCFVSYTNFAYCNKFFPINSRYLHPNPHIKAIAIQHSYLSTANIYDLYTRLPSITMLIIVHQIPSISCADIHLPTHLLICIDGCPFIPPIPITDVTTTSSNPTSTETDTDTSPETSISSPTTQSEEENYSHPHSASYPPNKTSTTTTTTTTSTITITSSSSSTASTTSITTTAEEPITSEHTPNATTNFITTTPNPNPIPTFSSATNLTIIALSILISAFLLLVLALFVIDTSEWVWPVGYFLRAQLGTAARLEETRPGLLGRTVTAIKGILSAHNIALQSGPWKSLPELTNKDGAVCNDSCPAQAWSMGCILEVLYDLQQLTTKSK